MEIQYLVSALLALCTCVFTLWLFVMKKIIERLERIEDNISDHITRDEARNLVDDKIELFKYQIKAIDAKLDRVIHMLLERND